MDIENLKSWASQPDVCRCCLSASGTWDLTASHITDAGIKEVYCDMIHECFGINLSYLSEWGPSRLICTLCVGHLRDACSFRKQVLRAEEHFIEYFINRKGLETVKTEVERECLEAGCLRYDLPTAGRDEVDAIKTEEYDSPGHDEAAASDNDYETVEIFKQNTRKTLATEQAQIRRKARKIRRKTKRKRKKTTDDDDSDTPIARLSKKNQPSDLSIKVDNREDVENIQDICDLNDESKVGGDKVNISNTELHNRTGHLKKTSSKMSAENYIDNRNLRSNITLVLKYSTILPFKHINNSKYICLYCDKAYLFFKELKEHVHDKHKNVTEQDIIYRLKTPKDLIKADISNIKCRLCEQPFKTVDKIIEHLTDVHKKVYYHTPRLKPSHGILGFDLSSENLKCYLCFKEFRFFKNLSVHMNEHSDNFMCHICGKKFVSDHRLQTHVIMHRRADKIRCKHCDKDFRSTSARSYHIRKEHKGSKFKCPECSQIFGQYQHRLKHLVETHHLKKPEFRCETCLKEFASSGGLRAHIRYSHLKTTEYPCEVCGKVFVYKWIWQRHMDVHTGAKNYECKFCSKKFAKPYTLQVHLRIHLNDKRFSCDFCKAAFVQKCSLKNHIRVHHPDGGVDLSKL